MKKLLLLLVLLALILAAGMWFAGDLLKKGVEEGGTWALGSKTSLSSASLSVLSGEVSMEGLNVASPEGFEAKSAMSVGLIDVKAAVGSFLSDTLEIDHIDIGSPEITLEIGTGGSNLGALMDHLKSKTGGGGPTAPAPKEEPGGPSKKLKIGRVTITSPTVILAQSLLMKTEQRIELPTLELTDIGGGKEGGDGTVTLSELLEEIFGTIMAAVAKAGALPADLQGILDGEVVAKYADKIQGQLQDIKGKAGEALDQVGEQLDDAKDKAGEALEDLKGGLGGLLGGDGKKK
ncbi:MAG: hypothetical protein V2A76_04680 [Planctomycetota bacterium]